MTSIYKSFGGKDAVVDLTLKLPPGEIFGLLGPNGAGKSTTLRMISGLVHPDSGAILIDGFDVMDDPDRARARCGYVPDEPTVYPRLTGREFLRFSGRLRSIDPDDLEDRISFHEKLFDMTEWLDKRTESYSHGMIQRVVLSAAFIAKPALYAIDEPLVGLDPAAAETFHRMARSAVEAGSAVLLSTHTLPVAHRFCDRLGIIHQGRLRECMNTNEIAKDDLEEVFFRITGTGPADVKEYFLIDRP